MFGPSVLLAINNVMLISSPEPLTCRCSQKHGVTSLRSPSFSCLTPHWGRLKSSSSSLPSLTFSPSPPDHPRPIFLLSLLPTDPLSPRPFQLLQKHSPLLCPDPGSPATLRFPVSAAKSRHSTVPRHASVQVN